MARETTDSKRRRAAEIVRLLDEAMPEAVIELDYQNPLQLLVSVLLAAQSTDKRVNLVSPALFRDFPTAAHYAGSTPKKIEPYIKTVGLFRSKARHLVALGKALLKKHGGEVPTSRALLEALPGVGKKTAGVVSMHIGGDTAFPVDTHVFRLSHRMGFTAAKVPDKVELDMRRVVEEPLWFKGHQLLVWHGRRVCHARKPECYRCVVKTFCPKRNVKELKPSSRAPTRDQP
ncbi:MAG: endonuclease III [Myxococcaceae bacterium]|nr:endonuclease III [Myxococcaceae bacterium]